jgi:hypothetical protein
MKQKWRRINLKYLERHAFKSLHLETRVTDRITQKPARSMLAFWLSAVIVWGQRTSGGLTLSLRDLNLKYVGSSC